MVLILMFLLLSSPFTVVCPQQSVQKGSSILTLDVCHNTGNGVPANFDAFLIHESQSEFAPFGFSDACETLTPVLSPFLLAFQMDHPPEILTSGSETCESFFTAKRRILKYETPENCYHIISCSTVYPDPITLRPPVIRRVYRRTQR